MLLLRTSYVPGHLRAEKAFVLVIPEVLYFVNKTASGFSTVLPTVHTVVLCPTVRQSG